MPDAQHAILMNPEAQGWAWELVDAEGRTVAKGLAPQQEEAMESAWLAARSRAEDDTPQYPEIVVDHGRSDLGSLRQDPRPLRGARP
jgi:hypothetical protein